VERSQPYTPPDSATLRSWRLWLAQLLRRTRVLSYSGVVTIALLSGACLRLWNLNTRGFNSDEAVYVGQAAAIAGDETLSQFFPMFRAHPLLYQFLLALLYPITGNSNIDLAGRLLSVAIGIATVFLVYRLGTLLYGEATGTVAALLLAFMPYHVTVTRQVLLDGPMVFLTTLALYFLARYVTSQINAWLYAASVALGFAFLAKEPSIIFIVAIYVFLALSREVRVQLGPLMFSLFCMGIAMLPFPLAMQLAGGAVSETGQQYFAWQLFRRPNHEWTFYLTDVPPLIGILVILAAILGLGLLWQHRTWRERLLIAWILVPLAFFQLWPVKGLQYLLPIAPPLAVLAARALVCWSPTLGSRLYPERNIGMYLRAAAIAIVVLSLAITSWARIQPFESDRLLAGSGGMPYGREAGAWIRNNTPEGAQFMTIGPSMANITQFYGHRKALALSVSTNPLHRNPAYEPIRNPDLQLRNAEMHYIVWDAYSANRSSFFSQSIQRYVRRYNGRIVHAEYANVKGPDGKTIRKPVIIIYEVSL
jgi:4-amino-4-deoxy-L-arabinose transferase-like glycosyltransferase